MGEETKCLSFLVEVSSPSTLHCCYLLLSPLGLTSFSGGVLEILLVNAQNIIHTNVIGRPKYYVIIEYGNQVCRSKTSKGNHEETCWNEKIKLEVPAGESEAMVTYLKFKIMDKVHFGNDGYVGHITIYLKGLIMEANENDLVELKPTPYNVVLKDDTYKGKINIGLKFIPNAVLRKERINEAEGRDSFGQSICKSILKYCQIPFLKFFGCGKVGEKSGLSNRSKAN